MSTIFISDLHLQSSDPKTTGIFLNFLNTQCLHIDALYILGDLFELWLRDDKQDDFQQTIIQALAALTQRNIPVYFIRGNRDFLIDESFSQKTGCKILPDPCIISLYNQTIVLTHGDTLCTEDTKYLRYRAFIQHHWIIALIQKAPLSWIRRVGQKIRDKSRQHTYHTPLNKMQATPSAIQALLSRYAVTQLIHGHTHQPTIQHFLFKNKMMTRFVLSDWHERGNALICYADGTKRLIYFG